MSWFSTAFTSLKSYVVPTEEDWEIWQKGQGPEHYQKSRVWQSFLAYAPKFKVPDVGITVSDSQYDCYHYCFGEFTPLIIRGQLKPSPIPYFRTLLDIYTCNKGYVRSIMGEREFISLLRKAIMENELSELAGFNYATLAYRYDKIHAHTVAEYSLSRLLALLTENALVYQGYNTLKPISIKSCHEAWSLGLYSKSTSPAMLIKKVVRQVTQDKTWDQSPPNFLPSSWPEYCGTNGLQKCSRCGAVCGRTYTFGECKECHITTVCSICGSVASDLARDGLPKCVQHL